MPEGGSSVRGDDLPARVQALGSDVLLPPRRAGTDAPDAPVLHDLLMLPGGSVLSVLRAGREFLVAPLIDEPGAVRRATAGDGAFAGIWTTIRAGGRNGRFTARPAEGSPAADLRAERGIDVDQSNDSVVVGEAVVVKLYPRTVGGPQPGSEIPAHLAAAGFTAMPRPLGSLTWTSDDGEEVLLATAAAYLPGARDGWEWYLERLLAWLDGDVDDIAVLGVAETCGGLIGELHAAMATPTHLFPTPVIMGDAETAASWRARARSLLDEALDVTGGDEGARLREREGAVRATLDDLAVERTPLMRIHGDLHVGQILAWDGGYAVADFDGDPVAPAEVRSAPDAPARDVAAFVRSVDHLGRVAQARRPGRDADLGSWIEHARVRVLGGYRAGLAAHGRPELFDARLLRPFEVAQELHEYVYAARFLPRWRYVPDLALRAMFPGVQG
jgi:maltokinase